MYAIFRVNRSIYYHESSQQSSSDDEVEQAIIRIFDENQHCYGRRKIKATLQKVGRTISRRRIGCLMKKNGLVSEYTIDQYKSSCNDAPIQNRELTKDEPLEAVVSI